MVQNNLLQATPHNLRKAHLVFRGNSLGLTVERVWNLNLRFYHDGNLTD